jgi:uncharacterized protein YdhG (YjbR/CyaY superfamily)
LRVKQSSLPPAVAYLWRRKHDEIQVKDPTTELTTIDQYIRRFPKDIRQMLSELRSTIREAAPQACEKISYRIPTFYYNGNLVHFAAFKNHIGFYPTSSGIAAFRSDLKKYKHAKGSVQFPVDEPLPLKLITRIVKFRAAENSHRSPKNKR